MTASNVVSCVMCVSGLTANNINVIDLCTYIQRAEWPAGLDIATFLNAYSWHVMVIRVVEFSSGGTKFERFLPKSTYAKEIIEFSELV